VYVKYFRGKRFLIPVISLLALLALAAFWMCYERQVGIELGPTSPHDIFKFRPSDSSASQEAREFLQAGVTPRAILERAVARDPGAAERWELGQIEVYHISSFSPRYGCDRLLLFLGRLQGPPDDQIESLQPLFGFLHHIIARKIKTRFDVRTPSKRLSGKELDEALRDGDVVILVDKNESPALEPAFDIQRQ
jgi:hypothetical protein